MFNSSRGRSTTLLRSALTGGGVAAATLACLALESLGVGPRDAQAQTPPSACATAAAEMDPVERVESPEDDDAPRLPGTAPPLPQPPPRTQA